MSARASLLMRRPLIGAGQGGGATGYAATVEGIPGLLSYWRLSSTASIPDEVGGRTGAWIGGSPTGVAGLPASSDNGASLPSGVNGEVAHDAGLAIGAGTILFWFRFPTLPTGSDTRHVLGKDQSGAIQGDLGIYVRGADGKLVAFMQDGTSGHDAASRALVAGQTYMGAMTFGAGGHELWLDGRFEAANPGFGGGLTANTQPLRLGRAPWSASIGDVVLDEIAIWSRELSDAELITLSQVTAAPTVTGGSASVSEAATVTIPLESLASAWVGRKSSLTLAFPSQGAHGTASATAGNDVQYTANSGTVGQADSFTYTVADANGASASGTVDVTIASADAYSGEVSGLSNLVAYWRLGNPASIGDDSGNGHTGTFSGTPTQVGDLTEAWQGSDGAALDFGGAASGSVAHAAAFALTQGSLACWFQVDTLTATRYLLCKADGGTVDDYLELRVLTNGTLEARFLADGATTTTLATAAGTITTGERHHVVVTWTAKMVRLWLDGRQVAKSEGHTTGLTGNGAAWRFGSDPAGAAQDVRLDEVALYSRARLFGEVQALSQRIAGMGYRDADALRVVNVSSASALSSAISSAIPGDHIVVANGSYTLTVDVTASGTRANPIVIRSSGGYANCSIDGEWDLEGDWIIVDGFTWTDGTPEIWGNHCRFTRIRNENFVGQGVEIKEGRTWNRVDHCRLGPPVADSGGQQKTNQPLRVRSTNTAFSWYNLADHVHLIGTLVDLGNGRDGYSVGGGLNSRQTAPYCTLYKSIIEDSVDEVVSMKASSCFMEYCTFGEGVYAQIRSGSRCEWRSCFFSGSLLNDFGEENWIIGCTFDSEIIRIGPGDADWDTYTLSDSNGTRPASEDAKIIGCTFLGSAIVRAGEPDWQTTVKASGTQAEGCTNWGVTYTADYIGTITHLATTDEPFDVAVQLTSSDVGLSAADPLVPPGWK